MKIIGLIKYNSENTDTVYIGSNDEVRSKDFRNNLDDEIADNFPMEINKGEIVLSDSSSKIEDRTYYEFAWDENKKNIDFSIPFRRLSPKEIVYGKHNSILATDRDMRRSLIKTMSTLQNQLTAGREDTFVYELLQNANDYPVKGQLVDVQFTILPNALLFFHTGREFNDNNVMAICDVNYGDKEESKDTVGYKGIGFKTVFHDCDFVYIKTGGYSFRLDKKSAEEEGKLIPWQAFPIWTPLEYLSEDESNAVIKSSKDYHVKMVLCPRDKVRLKSYVDLFHRVFDDERVILFVKNINKVRVDSCFMDAPIICEKNSARWLVDSLEADVAPEVTESINKIIKRAEENNVTSRIPSKYKDFKTTRVSFACQKEGNELIGEPNARIYCYLPTQISWGFNFLMNTDMIPTGSRDSIEKGFDGLGINLNEVIAEIAGQKFFDWIASLCKSNKYTLRSIFSLVPDLKALIVSHPEYANFLEKFKEGFEKKLRTKPFIPINGGEYVTINQTVLDKSGLTENHLLSDDEFFAITGYSNLHLPIDELRNDSNFMSLMTKWMSALNLNRQVWGKTDLQKKLTEGGSQLTAWLKNESNNDQFIDLLISKDWLKDFCTKKIFIEEFTGELFSAKGLYWEVKDFENLRGLKDFVRLLSVHTRKRFEENKKCEDIQKEFKDFVTNDFLNARLLSYSNKPKLVKLLYDKETSWGFYKFLASDENIKIKDELKDLPFFNQDNELVDNFDKDFIFTYTPIYKEITSETWLNKAVSIEFVSKEYGTEVEKLFLSNFKVKKFSHRLVVQDIIQNGKYVGKINKVIKSNDVENYHFADYCFSHGDYFKGQANGYVMKVANRVGVTDWLVVSEEPVFFKDKEFSNFAGHKWLPDDSLYSISYRYIPDHEHQKFMENVFGIRYLNAKRAYDEVVAKNLYKIFKTTSIEDEEHENLNYSFVQYLDENANYIFKELNDKEKYAGFNIITTDGLTSVSEQKCIYLYSDELVEISGRNWITKDSFSICSKKYGESAALRSIGVKKYTFSDFFKNVISPNIDAINSYICSKEANLDFHRFIFEHRTEITDSEIKVIQNACIFLAGHDEVAQSSNGHFYPSEAISYLIDKGYVNVSMMNLIDPVYYSWSSDSKDYWENKIGNERLSLQKFADLLKQEDFKSFLVVKLQDEDANIDFWTWAKKTVNDRSILHQFLNLPVLLQGGGFSTKDDTIYLSDEYLSNGKIENVLRKYNPKADIVSANYLKQEGDKDDWCEFWTKVGLKKDILDILIESIKSGFKDLQLVDLPITLADYKDKLEEKLGDSLTNHLAHLQLSCKGGYFDISNAIMIDCDDDEPFEYIILPNEVTIDDAQARRLIKDSMPKEHVVKSNIAWISLKINEYLRLQEQREKIEGFNILHFKFINDLTELKSRGILASVSGDFRDKILILDREGNFCNPKELTLGSVYKPLFDFESCNVPLHYVSNEYKKQCNNRITSLLGADFKVHSSFLEEDIQYLGDTKCAEFFWRNYVVSQKKSHAFGAFDKVKSLVRDRFNDVSCIPTLSGNVRKPSELYSLEIFRYAQHTPLYADKVPMAFEYNNENSACKELYSMLEFRKELDFNDALSALDFFCRPDHSLERSTLVRWLVNAYTDADASKMAEYRLRESSVWLNRHGEPMPVSKMYALDIESPKLVNYFGGIPCIIDSRYLTDSDYFFKSACDVLQIPVITDNDITIEPISGILFKEKNQDLKIFSTCTGGFHS